jgi:putative oxidoreductase
LPKLVSAEGRAGFAGMLGMIGVPAPELMAWVVGFVEVLGALALLAGVATTFAAALLIVNMLVAMFMVHWPAGFDFVNITGMTESGPQFGLPGYEVNLLYIAMLLAILLGGPGRHSVEGRRTAGGTGYGVGDPGWRNHSHTIGTKRTPAASAANARSTVA